MRQNNLAHRHVVLPETGMRKAKHPSDMKTDLFITVRAFDVAFCLSL